MTFKYLHSFYKNESFNAACTNEILKGIQSSNFGIHKIAIESVLKMFNFLFNQPLYHFLKHE